MDTVAVVANPTKLDDPARTRQELGQLAEDKGHSLLWLETTAKDPGAGQTREALERGATMVCALGGDGTVRAVAAELVGTGTPLGLLPGGTGNLLARNLELPVDDVPEAFAAALDGAERTIDVGWLTRDEHPREIFLVMAGIGLDAEVMAETSEQAKARLGWMAYTVTGARKLLQRGFRVRITTDDHRIASQHARTVLVGNCGAIQGGIQLLPLAEPDDGRIDLLLLAPHGLVGWAAAALRILTRTQRGHRPVGQFAGRRFLVETRQPVAAEIDGDHVGDARRLDFEVQPAALAVRVTHH